MKRFLSCLMVAALALNVSACGVKGRLKTPDQMERDAEKKERKEAKKKADAEKKQKETPAPQPEVAPAGEEP